MVEGLKDYVKIYVENEPHPILSLMSLKSLEDVLPSDRFIRVHRSFIVQIRQNQDYRTKSDRFWETIHSDFPIHTKVIFRQ